MLGNMDCALDDYAMLWNTDGDRIGVNGFNGCGIVGCREPEVAKKNAVELTNSEIDDVPPAFLDSDLEYDELYVYLCEYHNGIARKHLKIIADRRKEVGDYEVKK